MVTSNKVFYFCVQLNKCLFCLLFSLLFSVSSAFANNPTKTTDQPVKQWADSVVQVLAYKGDQLLNQGSGVVVTTDGVVITSAHLLAYADRVVLQGDDSLNKSAAIISKNEVTDLAILRSSTLQQEPVKIALNSVSNNDSLEIAGYWSLSIEKARGSFFSFSKRPKFVASELHNKSFAKALLNGSGAIDGRYSLIASIGRGGYGAPVVNRCGELLGIVSPKREMTLKQLWKPHLPTGVEVIDISILTAELSASNIVTKVADKPCLSAIEQQAQAQIKQQAQINKAKKKIKEAEKQVEKEKQARKEAEKGRSDITEIVSNINTKAESLGTENIEIKEDNKILFWSVVGAIAVAIFIILLLLINKKKSSRLAKEELKAATASFGDCRFEGVDSSGAPVAFIVLGKDLMQRKKGLVVGRNPDLSQVVIADDTVSREHARLFVKDNRLNIIDLGSTGGTQVNKQPVGPEGLIIIAGDIVEFGEVRCTLSILGGI
ncbi:MAG: FHA domain-containing protein [Cycloclasticus sp.]|jgi:hypothetical protein|uniref:FHA domain-containing protein n=1 Tax=Cycloclasticus sp. TaxID=2024830 RepID=UPI00257CE80A|nr:FHA domain-containing protein [Cycloclasticus sp.]MBV1898752.1 FHA domain-containing protein [Cycloclasticus sp.]